MARSPASALKKITLSCKDGDKEIVAEVTGALALHDPIGDLGDDGYKATISHVPTGMRICRAPTRTAARRIIKSLSSLADWYSVRPGMRRGEATGITPELAKAARAAILDGGGYR